MGKAKSAGEGPDRCVCWTQAGRAVPLSPPKGWDCSLVEEGGQPARRAELSAAERTPRQEVGRR